MDDEEKLYVTSFPNKGCFHNVLYSDDISNEDCAHAQETWNHFECKSSEDDHNLYLRTDVLLIQGVFEVFIKTCMECY